MVAKRKGTKGVKPNGSRITELRTAKGLTQDRLSFKAGVSPRTLVRAVGGTPISPATLLNIATALDVPVDEVVAKSADPGSDTMYSEGWPIDLRKTTSAKRLIDLISKASFLRFNHDNDPDEGLAERMTHMIELCEEAKRRIGDPEKAKLREFISSAGAAKLLIELQGRMNSILLELGEAGVGVFVGDFLYADWEGNPEDPVYVPLRVLHIHMSSAAGEKLRVTVDAGMNAARYQAWIDDQKSYLASRDEGSLSSNERTLLGAGDADD